MLPDETVQVSFRSTCVIENKEYKQCGKPFVSHFTIDLVVNKTARRRGCPKLRLKDVVKQNLKNKGIY